MTKFDQDNTHILSAADDKTLRCWDLPTGKETVFKDVVKFLGFRFKDLVLSAWITADLRAPPIVHA